MPLVTTLTKDWFVLQVNLKVSCDTKITVEPSQIGSNFAKFLKDYACLCNYQWLQMWLLFEEWLPVLVLNKYSTNTCVCTPIITYLLDLELLASFDHDVNLSVSVVAFLQLVDQALIWSLVLVWGLVFVVAGHRWHLYEVVEQGHQMGTHSHRSFHQLPLGSFLE